MAVSPAYSPVVTYSALQFDEPGFLNHAYDTITGSMSPKELVYTDVPLSWGMRVGDYLDEVAESRSGRKHYNAKTRVFWVRVMPTDLLDCQQDWWRHQEIYWQTSGLLTAAEKKHLNTRVGTTITSFHGPYEGSREEPDLLIRLGYQRLPSVVFESGWSGSFKRLEDDMNLWLVGGSGTVNAVLLLKWTLPDDNNNAIHGVVEMYMLDDEGVPELCQRETIFPKPESEVPQRIHLTRRLLFGSSMFPGRPNDTFPLDVDALRTDARRSLTLMGLVPAT